jgi:hypothetical protein
MLPFSDLHPAWCHCASCEPYIPADRSRRDQAQLRFLAAAGLALAIAVTAWVLA